MEGCRQVPLDIGGRLRPDSWRVADAEVLRDISVPMRDGQRLATDVYLPARRTSGLPTLLLRTPYGKRLAGTEAYAHPLWYAGQGFAVVCQDTRGRGSSDGEFYPFRSEAADGADSLAWIAAQPWCSGAIGMYGFSYLGVTQLLAATSNPPELRAMAPAVTGSNYHEGWTYRNGVLQWAFVLGWTAELAADTALRNGDEHAAARCAELLEDLDRVSSALPLYTAVPEEVRRYAPYFGDWLDHPSYDDYWRATAPREHYEQMRMPALHIGGWYDIFLEGTVENYRRLTDQHPDCHHMLVLGPWRHMPWSRTVGAIDFGCCADLDIDELQCRFFGRWLRGDKNGIEGEPPVRVFVMGVNRWRLESRWPVPSVPEAFHLSSSGRASRFEANGMLSRAPANAGEAPDVYVSDPANPVRSLGGRSCCLEGIAPMGPADQSQRQLRRDVLVYDSPPLERDYEIIGTPVAELFIAADAPSGDVVVQLADVAPNGMAVNVADGVVRLHRTHADEAPQAIRVSLSPTANRFAAGHVIRLDIAGSSFPVYNRNPQSHVPASQATLGDLRAGTHLLFHDRQHPSRLVLPQVTC
jgi:putative CocE/NonD family hydrolase